MEYHHKIRLAVLILSLLISCYGIFKKNAAGKAESVGKEKANAALQELRQWSTFLIGIQGSAIAIMGFLFEKIGNKEGGKDIQLDAWQVTVATTAIIFFGTSILLATWLLGAIPSIVLRISDNAHEENNIFRMNLFSFMDYPKVGPITGLQFGFFIAGVVAFSSFAYMRIANPE